ncbi:Alpha/Beta hydrolase protein [Obelidium mucronatum]|nr:Alpha/Beta hydrolase protein [Obelidium mucronatum]
MDQSEAEGVVKAEWVAWDESAESSPLSNSAVVLYFHGGGYCFASRKTHRGITWKIAKYANCRVLSVDYRLAPEHVFPLALHDAISAYAFLTNPPGELNLTKYNPKKVVIMGDSAGGGLTLALLLWLRDHGAEFGLQMPGGAGLISPWLDLTHSTRSYQSNGKWDYLPDRMRGKMLSDTRSHYYVKDNSFLTNPLVSPLFAKEDPARSMCPLLIHIGECERMRDENLVFVSRVFKESPIQLEMYDAMVHVFQMFNNFLPLAELALERLGMFVQKVTRDEFDVKRSYPRMLSRFSCEEGFAVSDLTREEIDAYLFEDDAEKKRDTTGSKDIVDDDDHKVVDNVLAASAKEK